MDSTTLIETLYRSFREKDYDTFRSLCTDDLTWIQNPGFPGGATRHGAEAVIEGVFESFDASWSEFRFELEEVLDAGASVVVLGRYTGRHRETGRAFDASAAHVYDLREGKVARFRQYTDTRLIADAMASA